MVSLRVIMPSILTLADPPEVEEEGRVTYGGRPTELRAHPLGILSHGIRTMQTDEEIQYAPRSRPVSFYDNYKVSPYSRVSVSRVSL